MPAFIREQEEVEAHQWDGVWTKCVAWLDELEVAGKFVVPFGYLPPVRPLARSASAPLVVDQPDGRTSCRLKDWLVFDEKFGIFLVSQPDFFAAHYKVVEESTIDTTAVLDERAMSDESDGEVLARLGTDGMRWAEEFLKTHGAQPVTDDTLDLFHTWFANAIEAGRSAGAAEENHRINVLENDD